MQELALSPLCAQGWHEAWHITGLQEVTEWILWGANLSSAMLLSHLTVLFEDCGGWARVCLAQAALQRQHVVNIYWKNQNLSFLLV